MVIMNNTTLTIVSEDGKFGIRNLNGEIIVPCRYDEIHFDERSSCFTGKRDGKFLERFCGKEYTGVIDLFSERGEFLIGGANSIHFVPTIDLFFIRFGGIWKNIGYVNENYKFYEDKSEWIVLDKDMTSIWKHKCFKGESNIAVPNYWSFQAYHFINNNQFIIRKERVIGVKSFTKYQLVFIKEKIITENVFSWCYPISNNASIALTESRNAIKLISVNHTNTAAEYEYISTPFKGWCIGIAHMRIIPYDEEIAHQGYCVLLNIYKPNNSPLVLFKNVSWEKVERMVNANIIQIFNIEDAATSEISNKYPDITISSEFFSAVSSALNDNVKSGPSTKEMDPKISFISVTKMRKDKQEYFDCLFPPSLNIEDDVSYNELEDAFEGEADLYDDWLNS